MQLYLTPYESWYIMENYEHKSAPEIARELKLKTHQVYKAVYFFGLGGNLNPVFDITDTQDQIILGSILGDGNFKKNGSNYYYRECHAVGEKEYCLWKYEELYDLTTKKIYNLPSRNGHSPQIAFQTRNSSSFNKYVNMTIEEVISCLSPLGYLIWILDDGWIRRGIHTCDIHVAGGSLTLSQKNLLSDKGKEIGLDGHLIGIKSVDFSFLSHNNKRIKEIAYNYFPKSLDIMRKKINNLTC